jgi:hypothetical protein
MLCVPVDFCAIFGVPIILVYMNFFVWSIFLDLNITMTWHYNNSPVDQLPTDCVGFVYEIICLENNRRYIGKKLAKFKTLRYKMHTQKNGKKVRKRIRGAVDSDWKEYYGSSDALHADMKRFGKDKFKRIILRYCHSKAECNYWEAHEQFNKGVLLNEQYYNGHIRVRVHGKGLAQKK